MGLVTGCHVVEVAAPVMTLKVETAIPATSGDGITIIPLAWERTSTFNMTGAELVDCVSKALVRSHTKFSQLPNAKGALEKYSHHSYVLSLERYHPRATDRSPTSRPRCSAADQDLATWLASRRCARASCACPMQFLSRDILDAPGSPAGSRLPHPACPDLSQSGHSRPSIRGLARAHSGPVPSRERLDPFRRFRLIPLNYFFTMFIA